MVDVSDISLIPRSSFSLIRPIPLGDIRLNRQEQPKKDFSGCCTVCSDTVRTPDKNLSGTDYAMNKNLRFSHKILLAASLIVILAFSLFTLYKD